MDFTFGMIFLHFICGFVGYFPVSGATLWDNDRNHPVKVNKKSAPPENYRDFINPPREGPLEDWQSLGQRALQESVLKARELLRRHHPAKNGIFFMGDGMGMSTHVAARVYLAQSRNLTGDEARLSWEDFPYTALAQTYATDLLVPDSANTATAMMCGEKCREAVICANQHTVAGNCTSMQDNQLKSVLHHAIEAGKWTGLVGTSSITEASLAVNYAHSPLRDWANDADMAGETGTQECSDIASQLVEEGINNNIRVILSGGRADFLNETVPDPEYPEMTGARRDGKNLIETWKQRVNDKSSRWKYVENLTDFNAVNAEETDYLMGLFEPGGMHYEVDRTDPSKNVWEEPSLAQMVEKAVRLLSRGPQGYFLFVEAGKIDNAHHANNAFRALNDTAALSDAVAKARELTSDEDTLIILTADHSHTFHVSGYPARNTDIFKYNEEYERGWGFQYADDDKPYTTLVYSTGPGYYAHRQNEAGDWTPRKNISLIKDQLDQPDQLQDSMIPLESGTHSGEDVPIYSMGPMSYLLQGVQEQSVIAHVLKYAMCLGESREMCDNPPVLVDSCRNTGNFSRKPSSLGLTLFCVITLFKIILWT